MTNAVHLNVASKHNKMMKHLMITFTASEICTVLPVIDLDMLAIANTHINLDVLKWQTDRRDIWLTEHECHLQIKVNRSHTHSQARYNIYTFENSKHLPSLLY